MSQPEGTPKIIIDTDWKAQAEAEKQKLAAKLETPAQAPKAPAGKGSEPGGQPSGASGAGKLEVDSDWKAQAEAEKAKLSAQAGGGAGAAQGEATGGRGMDEPARFEDLISLLTSQAMMYLGAFPDPRTGQAIVGLDYARLHIDLLGVLEEKTRGNLSQQESTLLQRVLSELRLEYVEVAKAVEQAVAQGKIRPAAAGMGGGAGKIATPKPPTTPTMTFNFPGGPGAPGGAPR